MINVSGWNLAADEEEDNHSEPPAKIPAVGLMIFPPQQWIIFSEIYFSFLKVLVQFILQMLEMHHFVPVPLPLNLLSDQTVDQNHPPLMLIVKLAT